MPPREMDTTPECVLDDFRQLEGYLGKRTRENNICAVYGRKHVFENEMDGQWVCNCGVVGHYTFGNDKEQQKREAVSKLLQEATGDPDPTCTALLPSVPLDAQCSACTVGSLRRKIELVRLAKGLHAFVSQQHYPYLGECISLYVEFCSRLQRLIAESTNLNTRMVETVKQGTRKKNSIILSGSIEVHQLQDIYQRIQTLTVTTSCGALSSKARARLSKCNFSSSSKNTYGAFISTSHKMVKALTLLKKDIDLPHMQSVAILCRWSSVGLSQLPNIDLDPNLKLRLHVAILCPWTVTNVNDIRCALDVSAAESALSASNIPVLDVDMKTKRCVERKSATCLQTFPEYFLQELFRIDPQSYGNIEASVTETDGVRQMANLLTAVNNICIEDLQDCCLALLKKRSPENGMAWICGRDSCCGNTRNSSASMKNGRLVNQDDNHLWRFQFGLSGLVGLRAKELFECSNSMNRALRHAGDAFWHSSWVNSRAHETTKALSVLSNKGGKFHNSLPLHPQHQLSLLGIAAVIGTFHRLVTPCFQNAERGRDIDGLTEQQNNFCSLLMNAHAQHKTSKGNAVVDAIVVLRFLQYKHFCDTNKYSATSAVAKVHLDSKHIQSTTVPFLPVAFGPQRNLDQFKAVVERTLRDSYQKATYLVMYTALDFHAVSNQIQDGFIRSSGDKEDIYRPANREEYIRTNGDGRLFGEADLNFNCAALYARVEHSVARIALLQSAALFEVFHQVGVHGVIGNESMACGLFVDISSGTAGAKKQYPLGDPFVTVPNAFASPLQSKEHQEAACALRQHASHRSNSCSDIDRDRVENIEDAFALLIIGKRTDRMIRPNVEKAELGSPKLPLSDNIAMVLRSHEHRGALVLNMKFILAPVPIRHLCKLICDLQQSMRSSRLQQKPPFPAYLKRTTSDMKSKCKLALINFGVEFFGFLEVFSKSGHLNLDLKNDQKCQQVVAAATNRFESLDTIDTEEWIHLASLAVKCSAFYGNMARGATTSTPYSSSTQCIMSAPFPPPHAIIWRAFYGIHNMVNRIRMKLCRIATKAREEKILVGPVLLKELNEMMQYKKRSAFSMLCPMELQFHIQCSNGVAGASVDGYDSFVADGVMKFVLHNKEEAYIMFEKACNQNNTNKDDVPIKFRLLQEMMLNCSVGNYRMWATESNTFSRSRSVIEFLIRAADKYGTFLEKKSALALDKSGFCFCMGEFDIFKPILSRTPTNAFKLFPDPFSDPPTELIETVGNSLDEITTHISATKLSANYPALQNKIG